MGSSPPFDRADPDVGRAVAFEILVADGLGLPPVSAEGHFAIRCHHEPAAAFVLMLGLAHALAGGANGELSPGDLFKFCKHARGRLFLRVGFVVLFHGVA